MRNRSPKMVEIVRDYPAIFRCKVCGGTWGPSIRPDSDGNFYRGSWQCPYGCKPEDTVAEVGGD